MDELKRIQAAAANGLSKAEVEGLLDRKLTEAEAREFNKTKAILKLKEKDEANQKAKKTSVVDTPKQEAYSTTPASIPKSRFRTAIWQSFGNMCALSRILKVNHSSLRNYLSTHDDLRELMDEARAHLIDQAEDYVAQCLSDENLDVRVKTDLAKFILKTQGKSRGWTEGPTIAQQINIGDEVDLKTIFGA